MSTILMLIHGAWLNAHGEKGRDELPRPQRFAADDDRRLVRDVAPALGFAGVVVVTGSKQLVLW